MRAKGPHHLSRRLWCGPSALAFFHSGSWGVAPGWYGAAPLALRKTPSSHPNSPVICERWYDTKDQARWVGLVCHRAVGAQESAHLQEMAVPELKVQSKPARGRHSVALPSLPSRCAAAESPIKVLRWRFWRVCGIPRRGVPLRQSAPRLMYFCNQVDT